MFAVDTSLHHSYHVDPTGFRHTALDNIGPRNFSGYIGGKNAPGSHRMMMRS